MKHDASGAPRLRGPGSGDVSAELLACIERVRDCGSPAAIGDVLTAAAALVEHAGYVMTRHTDNAPVTRLMLMASELEDCARAYRAQD